MRLKEAGLALIFLSGGAQALEYNPDDLAKKIVAAQFAAEMEMYKAIPDPVDCKRHRWIKDCDMINFLIKKNPGGPIRITTQDGVQHAFSPDTPAPILNAMLDPSGTTKSGEEIAKYMASLDIIGAGVGGPYSRYMLENKGRLPGNSPTPREIDEAQKNALAPFENDVNISIFVTGSCIECTSILSVAEGIKSRYPKIKMTVYADPNEPDYYEATVLNSKIPSQILSRQDAARVKAIGYPYVSISNGKTGEKYAFSGSLSGRDFEFAILYTTTKSTNTKGAQK